MKNSHCYVHLISKIYSIMLKEKVISDFFRYIFYHEPQKLLIISKLVFLDAQLVSLDAQLMFLDAQLVFLDTQLMFLDGQMS